MKIKLLILSFLLIFLVVAIIIILPRVIKIKTIVCKSQYGSCPEEISTSFDSLKGKNINYSHKEIESILKNNPYINEFSTRFKLPYIIEINLIIKKPYFSIKTKDGLSYLISKEGHVMNKTDSLLLPSIFIQENLEPGQKLEESLVFALKIVSDLSAFYKISSSRIEGNSLVVEMKSGPRAIFPLQGDEKVLVGALRLIIEQLNTNYENFRIDKDLGEIVIDLRYKNPILR